MFQNDILWNLYIIRDLQLFYTYIFTDGIKLKLGFLAAALKFEQ